MIIPMIKKRVLMMDVSWDVLSVKQKIKEKYLDFFWFYMGKP